MATHNYAMGFQPKCIGSDSGSRRAKTGQKASSGDSHAGKLADRMLIS
jgi:hypothetical protein